MQFRDKERTTFELRQVTDAELKNMQASMKGSGSTVHDGMGIRSQLDADPEAAKRAQPPGGIYKAKDEQGKEVMFIIMPFTVGLTKKVPC